MDTIEALKAVRELCAKGWTRGENYRLDGNPFGASRDEFLAARAKGGRAECCVSGALLTLTDTETMLWRQVWLALKPQREGVSTTSSIHCLNDSLHSQEEALAWMDRAIASCREESDAV